MTTKLIAMDPSVAMKDSGDDWIGKIASHWTISRLIDLSSTIQTGPFGSQLHREDYVEGGIPIVNPSHIISGRVVPDPSVAVTEETRARLSRYILRTDDIVLGRRGEMGRAALISGEQDGWICGTGSMRIRCKVKICYPQFLAFVLSSDRARKWFSYQSLGSTMENISPALISRFLVPIPTLEEQIEIVSFLYRETGETDYLIAKYEHLVEVLEERRAALVAGIVANGLNPGIKLKNTTAQFFEKIPDHWKALPLKHCVSIYSGSTPDKGIAANWDGGTIPWASAKDLKVDTLLDTEDHITELAISSGIKVMPSNVVLIVVRGMILSRLLPVVITGKPMAINQDLKALKPRPFLRAEYLALLLRSIGNAMIATADTSGHGTKVLRTEDWTKVVIPIPPLAEQDEIIKASATFGQDISELIAQAKRCIEICKERRDAVITAAVTGQVNVGTYNKEQQLEMVRI